LEEEEERVIYQRKLLLLNARKVREKEIDALIQLRSTIQRNKLEAGEKDLEMLLRNIEKQVSELKFFFFFFSYIYFHLTEYRCQ
jgi:hypothetical protein